MDMNDKLETLIADLYALDSSLQERDVEIRTLVTELRAARPDLILDSAFVHTLRSHLVKPHPFSFKTHHSINWWAVHLAPVGAIAVITLMLVPKFMTEMNTGETLMIPENTTFDTETAPSAKRAGVAPSESTSLMQVADNAMPADVVSVSPQAPGNSVVVDYVSFSYPGFIVIQKNVDGELGEVVGTSTLLTREVSGPITIQLSTTTKDGESYFARIFQDQGDEIFTLTEDWAEPDVTLATLFTITSGTGTVDTQY